MRVFEIYYRIFEIYTQKFWIFARELGDFLPEKYRCFYEHFEIYLNRKNEIEQEIILKTF